MLIFALWEDPRRHREDWNTGVRHPPIAPIFHKGYFPQFAHSKTNGKFVGHKNTSDPLQDRLNITWPSINLSNCATTHWSWNFNQRWSRGMTSYSSAIERINRLGKSANSSPCPYCTNVFARLNVTSVFKVVRGSGDPEVTVLIQFHWLLGLPVMKGWLIAGFKRQRLFAEGWEKTWWRLLIQQT